MYIVKSKWVEFKGKESVAYIYERGVYNFKRDSPPIEGHVLRLEESPMCKREIEVVRVLEATETYVKFQDQNYLTYEWYKK